MTGPLQEVLVLWLAQPGLDARTVAWSRWSGDPSTDTMPGDGDEAPYASGLAALRDGWRLFQVAPLRPATPGHETRTGYLAFEFWFERMVSGG